MLPEKLNDGSRDYVKVRDEKDYGNGISDVALYDSVPPSADYQFTPCLDFLQGLTSTPIMLKLER